MAIDIESDSTLEHRGSAYQGGFNIAVLTVSMSRYEALKRGEDVDDPSGGLLKTMLTDAGHNIVEYGILPDDIETIQSRVLELVDREDVDVIITTGGTGISPKDVTVESIEPLIAKHIPGFGELFRDKSEHQIGSAVILTRAVAGVLKGERPKVIFALPGSPNAVELALSEIIIPELPHIIKHATAQT